MSTIGINGVQNTVTSDGPFVFRLLTLPAAGSAGAAETRDAVDNAITMTEKRERRIMNSRASLI